MLSDYIAQRFQEVVEKTYYRLVLILASTSMFSVVLGGLSLIADASLRYIALLLVLAGFLSAKIQLRRASRKLKKLIERPEDEIRAVRYFQVLKELYTPEDYLFRISTRPEVVDPFVKNEKKRLEAGRELLKAKYSNLETRMKIVIVTTIMAIAIPHVIVTKDLSFIIFAALLAILLRKN